jgi:uncharacterized RDD family membrane protein YckC
MSSPDMTERGPEPGPQPDPTPTPEATSESASEEITVRPIPREARPYQGHRAGIASRFIADSIDLAIIVTAQGMLYLGWVGFQFLLQPTAGLSFPSPSTLQLLAGYFVLAVLYLATGWWATGRTIGKRLIGLRVVNFRGGPMRPIGSLLRALFCVFFPIGLFWVILSDENRSLADTVLRTSVIYDWRLRHIRDVHNGG